MGKATNIVLLYLRYKCLLLKLLKRIFIGLIILALLGAGVAYFTLLATNVSVSEPTAIYYKKADDNLVSLLKSHLKREASFQFIAGKMSALDLAPSGKYIIKPGMSNYDLAKMFRRGETEDIVIKIKAELGRDSVLNYLSENLGVDAMTLSEVLYNLADSTDEFSRENVFCVFLPDHYFFRWGKSAHSIIHRFKWEYDKFWTEQRIDKASELKLSPVEVCILASIVDGEAVHRSEMARIAGLYLNRIRKNIALQADPTILYMLNDEGRRRVLYADLEREDPYNTYLNLGLPPGPIMLPDKYAINSVLDAEKHDYVYMCAKADGSNLHEFTSSYREHLRNAALYQNYLDRQNTRR